MVFFPGLGGQGGITQMLLSFLMLIAFFVFFPRIMLFQIQYKMRKSLDNLQTHAEESEEMFLDSVTDRTSKDAARKEMEPMKNMVVSTPTGIDPTGLVDKLENLLDTTDEKMDRFVENITDKDHSDEQRANMQMGFKGVYGTQQIYVMVRHFKELIESTKNYQLGGMMQMMLPLYEEIAESQKAATEAFVNGVPIGDSVGPLIAANYMTNEPEELAEDVVVSEEQIGDNTVHVVKSNGPGSRLGKYGDAIEQVVEENDIGKMIFVDAGMRLEGEETGTVVDGTGVMMGGPGVEKYKIEEIARDHDVTIEGFIVKQSGPQASKPMHSKIYDAVPNAIERIDAEIAENDGELLIVGVGNTVGVGNSAEDAEHVPELLEEYWEEEDEDSTSYIGLMKAFPMGGGDAHGSSLSAAINTFAGRAATTGSQAKNFGPKNSFELFQSLVR